MSLATQIIALKMQIDQLKEKRDRIIAYRDAPDLTKLVWLADYPKDEGAPIVGQIVGTIELDREDNGDNINIYPAFSDEHLYDSARDGILTPTQVTNPFWAYFNVAVSPGIQKWYPRYRHAEISDIDYTAKTCTINIDPLYAASGTSGEDPLFINQDAETLYNVPIDYMDCTTPPFENFDKVLVMFTDLDWNQPVVKGYQTNPQPCSPDELVFFALGELGIIWDITENAYPTDFVGVQDYSDCLTYLAGKTETTMIDDYFGLPYTRLLRCYYPDAGGTEYHDKITTWGLPEQSSVPGYLSDKPELSDTYIPPVFPSAMWERITEWGDTVTPWDGAAGYITPAYTNNYYWTDELFGPLFYPGGVSMRIWSSWDYFLAHYVCPLDEDLSYYSYGTDAEYGNDPIGMGYPGAIMSENSIVQIMFSSHAETLDVGAPRPWRLDTVYTTSRETLTACACGTIGETTNPQTMPRNGDFSAAVYTLIEALHVLRGVEIMKDSPDYEGESCQGGGTTSENCAASVCNYWYDITNPKMELKLYRK